MTSIEQTGKNIEEATRLALEKLGVTEDEVDVEILEEGTRGFLGLGQAPARVRVTVKSAPPPARPAREAREPRRAPARRPRQPKRTAPTPEAPQAAEVETAPQPTAAPPAPAAEPETAEETPIAVDVQQAAEIGRDVLQTILRSMGESAKVVVRSAEDETVVLDMQGGDTAILIGKHGQTIDALQYLVGVITNKRLGGKVRIVLDAEGYRGRREQMLRERALLLAQKVRETGQEAVLESLAANERRIIHTTLANDPDVYTYSEGEGAGRHVVISPKSKSESD